MGEQAALDISVSIPGGAVRSGKLDFMKVLLQIPKDVIRKKQEAIARYAPRLQYAMPPLNLLQNRSDVTPWDPPFRDGVEVLMDGLFERTGHVTRNESTGIPHRLMQSREWSREYDVVKIKVPDDGEGDGEGDASTEANKVNSNTTNITSMKIKESSTPQVIGDRTIRNKNNTAHNGRNRLNNHGTSLRNVTGGGGGGGRNHGLSRNKGAGHHTKKGGNRVTGNN